MLKDRLILLRTVGEEAFCRMRHLNIVISWPLQSDVIGTSDVIGHVTIPSVTCHFL